jgi:WD40 repeat protein
VEVATHHYSGGNIYEGGCVFGRWTWLFAAVGRDVLVFEPSSGKELSRLKHHTDYVYAIAASSDGKYLASGGEDGRVCLWDARTLKQIKELDRHFRSVHDLSLHPQSEQLVAGGAGGLFGSSE